METDAHEEQTVLDAELEEDIENCGMEDDQAQTLDLLPVPLKNGSEMMDEVGEWVSHSVLLCLPPHLCYLLFVQQHETFFVHEKLVTLKFLYFDYYIRLVSYNFP